MISYKTNRRK